MGAARQPARWLIWTLMIGTCGCASPKVTFLSLRCESPKEGTRLQALVFVSAFRATGLQGEQVVHQVRLFDRGRQALLSRDGRYQTADGAVAAATTMMVLESPQTFSNVRLSIPAKELGVPPNQLPVLAEFTVSRASGECLMRAWRPLPSLTLAEVMPPLTTAPAPVPCWFVRLTTPTRLSILLGPFVSLAAAEAAVTDDTESPIQVASDQYLWFVPFYVTGVEGNASLVGPFSSEKDAWKAASLSSEMGRGSRTGVVAGAPVEIQVQQWLKQQKASGVAPSRAVQPSQQAPRTQTERERRRRNATGGRQE